MKKINIKYLLDRQKLFKYLIFLTIHTNDRKQKNYSEVNEY